MSKLGPISHFLSPVSCDSLVLQGLRCERCKILCYRSHSLILITGSSTRYLMAKKSEDLKKIIVALHKDGIGYQKIAKTLKLSCSTVAKTIQRFNRTGSTQSRPRHARQKKLSARAQHHIQRLSLGNRRMSAANLSAEIEAVGVSLSVLIPYAAHCTCCMYCDILKQSMIQRSPPFEDWVAGQYSNMITTPNTPPRLQLPC